MKTKLRKLSIIDWIIKLDDKTMLNQIEMLRNSDEKIGLRSPKVRKQLLKKGYSS